MDLQTGQLIRRIDTLAGSKNAGNENALGGVRLIKNRNNVVIGAYAGDLQGNLWRFDLQDKDPTQWKVGFNGAPLMVARSSPEQTQPITAAPEIIEHPLGGMMVTLGTGKLTNYSDIPDTSVQTLYGIWDRTPLGSASDESTKLIDLSLLVTQSIQREPVKDSTSTKVFYRSTNNPINWSQQRGWRLDMTLAAGQRNVLPAQNLREHVFFGTMVPANVTRNVNPCDESNGIGFNVLLNAFTGSPPPPNTFVDMNGEGLSIYQAEANGRNSILLGPQGKARLVNATRSRQENPQEIQLSVPPLERSWRQIQTFPQAASL